MQYKQFFNKLNKDDLGNYYLFTGEEEYMMNLALKTMKDKYVDEDFETLNYTNLEGKDTSIDEIVNATETLPFMSQKKLIVLKDVALFFKELKDSQKKELYKILDNLGDFLILIFLDSDSSLNKNTKLYREAKKQDRQVDFSKLYGQDRNKFISKIAKANGKEISAPNIKHFLGQSGYGGKDSSLNLYELENEFLKIVDYAKGDEISKEDIDSILIKSIDTNIFEFLDAFNNKKLDRSLMLLNVMVESGEPVGRIFFMMVRQVRLVLGCLLYKKKGYNDKAIIKKLKVSPYEFKFLSQKARGYNEEELEIMIDRLSDLDRQMKTTTTDEKLIVESFLVEMANNAYINK